MRRGRTPVHQARTELYRRLITEAAERVFAEHGFTGAHIGQIARTAGLSIGTLYAAFPGKKAEIFRAIQEWRGAELIGMTRAVGLEVWTQRGDVLAAMLDGQDALVRYFAAHPDYLRILLREATGWSLKPRTTHEEVAVWTEGMDGAVLGMQEGIKAGVLTDGDPVLMARTMSAMQQAHLGYWLEAGGRRSAEQVAADLRAQFLRAFCRPEVIAERGLLQAAGMPDGGQRTGSKPMEPATAAPAGRARRTEP